MIDKSLRFPIGEWKKPDPINEIELAEWGKAIASLPTQLKKRVVGLGREKNWQYRLGGWSIKQVVHHLADSHLNSFIRFKWALTEETPVIKAYDEKKWGELVDARADDLSSSLKIVEGIHARWSILINQLSEEDGERRYYHPETETTNTLREHISLYAWHGEHHLAHIDLALKGRGKILKNYNKLRL